MSTTSKGAYQVRSERGWVVTPPAHPDHVSSVDQLVEVAEERRRAGPLLADLFCGCGGLSLGAEAAGFTPVLGVDSDPLALETWRSLFPGLTLEADLGDPTVVDRIISTLRTIKVDAIVGGPPCQPFSRAGRSLLRHLVRTGKRDAHDERRELWRSFIDIVSNVLPSVVMLENVPELALGDDTLLLRTIVDELERIGFGVSARIVSTTAHGVPQFRQRIIVVAIRDGVEFEWPEPTSWHPTLRMAIADLPEVDAGWTRLGGPDEHDDYRPPPRANPLVSWFREDMHPGDESRVLDHVTRAVRDDDRQIFESMDSRTKYSDIDDHLKRYRDDIFDDKYKRLDWDQPSRSITAHLAKDGYWYIHPSQHRTLTIREAARVQTFPDRVRFAGPPSASLRQIGNAVPPLAALHLMSAALESFRAARPVTWTTREVSERLASWFADRTSLSLPWLDPDTVNAWQVIQSEMLLSRADQRTTRALWPVIEQMAEPCVTLERADRLRRLVQHSSRAEKLETLIDAARWYVRHPGDHFEHADAMAENPHVTATVAHTAELVSCPDESPVLGTTGVLRLAARFVGGRDDSGTRGSDGRVTIARLIGGSVLDDSLETAQWAHLALLELASSVCTPKRPRCQDCPLSGWCRYASVDPPDPRLF